MMKYLSTKTMIAVALLATTAFAAPAFAADEVNVTPGLTAVGAPLGLHGSDPVLLLDKGQQVEGEATYTGQHNGVAFYFTSKANLDTFKANPAKYTPQNGGFCTYGVSVGKKFDGDPEFAAVSDGKLYVFLNEEIFGLFKKDRPGTITKAAANWKDIKHKAATDL